MLARSCLKLCFVSCEPVAWRKTIFRSIIGLNSTGAQSKPADKGSFLSATSLVKRAPLSWQPYLRLMRVDKPTGTWLLFWPCAWSIGLAAPAGAWPSISTIALFGLGSFLMRAGGCIINDILDQKYDRLVERTKYRPLASGELTNKDALITLGFLLSGSLAILLQFNWFSVVVGSSSLFFAILYPYAKRWTYWPQVVLGVTLNYGVLISWAHLVPNNFLQVTPLFIATVIHTLIYDSIYSHQDKADDIIAGVKSTALLWGDQTKYWLTGFASLATALLCTSGILTNQTWPYYLGLAGTAAHLGWQIGTLKIDEPADCWNKFRSNQWIGLILFMGIVCGNFLKKKGNEEEEQQELDEERLDELEGKDVQDPA